MTIRTNKRQEVWIGNKEKANEMLEKLETEGINESWNGIAQKDVEGIRDRITKDPDLTRGKYMPQVTGMMGWLTNTVYPYMGTTSSVLGSMQRANKEDSQKLTRTVSKLLQASKSYGLTRINDEGVKCQTDAGWAGERGQGSGPRQSRSGILITVNGMPVYWSSKRQGVIALSSAEAEMYAGGEAIKWLKHIIYLLEEIGIHTERPCQVYSDSKALIEFASSGGQRTRMKHIDLRMGWIQDMTDENELVLKYVKGSDNGADILTKVLSAYKTREWCDTYMTTEGEFMKRE